MRAEFGLALRALVWAGRTYLRYAPVIVGLSLIASVQRLLVVGGTMPAALVLPSEVLVAAVRILLFGFLLWVAFRGERPRGAHAASFLRAHWGSLLFQLLLLGIAFAVFDLFTEQVISRWVPEAARQSYFAWLLFAKNPTVIAFTFVWLVGVLRQVLVAPQGPGSASPVPGGGQGRRVP